MRTLFLLSLVLFIACGKDSKRPPIDNAVDLDGNRINDSSQSYPGLFLQSASGVHEIDEDVFIAVHGFSASNFEWLEFASFCRQKGDVNVSRVLLGGHGRDYDDFAGASWEDWQKPIQIELEELQRIGYKRIHFIASSTGGALVLDLLGTPMKVSHAGVVNVFLVDPIVVPSNKQLSLAPVVGGTVVHYTESGLDPGENGRWYKYRPAAALKELDKLTRHVRKQLEKGRIRPGDIKLHVYKSEKDASADPVSAVIIEKAISGCEIKMIPTDLHVFTRLLGRPVVTPEDVRLQESAFEEIYAIAKTR